MSEGRGRQMHRQWSLLLDLQRRRRPATTRELWEALQDAGHDVTERTVRRDLLDLCEVGFGLERDDDKRWHWSRTGRDLASHVGTTEVVAFLVWLELQPAVALVDAPLRALADRFRAQLDSRARTWVDDLRARVQTTTPGRVTGPNLDTIHKEVAEAVNAQRVTRIRYWSASSVEETWRTVEPYLLWQTGGATYLVAHDHRRAQIRTFALQRIREVQLTDATFVPSPTFDAAAYTGRGFGVMHDREYRFQIEFHRDVETLVTERVWHDSQRVEPTAWGCMATWDMTGLNEFARWVAGLGGYVRIYSPPELMEQVRLIHESGLEEL